MVANAMIATSAEHFHDSGSHTVYHVASSYRNPITYKQINEIIIRYFKKSPLLGRSGMPIVPKALVLLSTKAMFRLYTSLRFKLPLQVHIYIDCKRGRFISRSVFYNLKTIILKPLSLFYLFFVSVDFGIA